MPRRNRKRIEDDVRGGIESYVAPARQGEPMRFASPAYHRLRVIEIDGGGRLAAEAQDDGAVGRVAAPRPRQRTVEVYPHPNRALQQAAGRQTFDERQRRLHGSDRVGRRWSDADLEELEHPDHAEPSLLQPLPTGAGRSQT